VSNVDLQKPLLKRSEVPQELTWNLDPIYSSPEEWEADFTRLEGEIEAFAAWQNTLEEGPQRLFEVLSHRDATGITMGKLRSYASLRYSEDTGNSDSQSRDDRVENLATRRAAATAWIEPEFLALNPETVQAWLRDEPKLALYAYYFEQLERGRPHTLSSEVEGILAQAYEPLGNAYNVFTLFNNADLKFPPIKDEEGREVDFTLGRYINFLESRDRRVREDAFRLMHGSYETWRNTLGANLSGLVKSHVFDARVRHFSSSLEAALKPKEIPTDVYTNLLSTVRSRLPVLHRYLRLRKKLLGLDELQMWDLYVPMVEAVDQEATYDEGKAMVLESSAPLGPEYNEVLARGLSERWVDVLENEGKRSGAFSNGSFATPPYILMNWQDKLDSAFTLSHEFGHSLHSYFTRASQPYVYSGYTIFVAEVASTLSENLLTHYLLEKARAEGNKPLQLSLLNDWAERFRTTLYRQTMFAEFELFLHTTVENNESLTADAMSEAYLQLNRDYYGAEVNVDDVVAIEWARIPHFYYDFYVYQYATGLSAAAALSKEVLVGGEHGQHAVERYLNFLRGGSSKNSIDLLRGAGVDMASPDPVNQALDVFESVIAQMEELSQ
jgi:oligoendopeptidase F